MLKHGAAISHGNKRFAHRRITRRSTRIATGMADEHLAAKLELLQQIYSGSKRPYALAARICNHMNIAAFCRLRAISACLRLVDCRDDDMVKHHLAAT